MSIEPMLDAIAQKRHDDAAEHGQVWCGHRTHPDRTPGKSCRKCVHQTVCWERWVRSHGDRVVRGEWVTR